jgi:hypothetical protein
MKKRASNDPAAALGIKKLPSNENDSEKDEDLDDEEKLMSPEQLL